MFTCRRFVVAGLSAAALVAPAAAQVIDGTRDPIYCAPLAVQNNQTGFGNASIGQPGFANGSELDNLSAHVSGGVLYLHLAGNVESNFNKLEIFFDTVAGGQNRLRGDNPDVSFNGLNRMGENPPGSGGNGLTFDAGFEADYWVSFTGGDAGGGVYGIFIDYARLRVDDNDAGEGYFVGGGGAVTDGTLNGGTNPFGILVTVNNSNTAGVGPGNGPVGGGENPADVTTGVELAIPLAAIGSPGADFKVCAFINGSGHDFLANQVLGGLGGLGNLGEPRNVQFNGIAGDQFVTIPLVTPACGACCIDTETCIVTTAAACSGGATYLGDNVSCAGNPCDAVETGACCRGTACTIETQTTCEADGGFYFGDSSTCDGAPCLTIGACCNGTTCTIATQNGCLEGSGEYLGGGTSCASSPCATGRCCTLSGGCSLVREEVCLAQDGFYGGDNTACDSSCNVGRCCVDTHCFVVTAAVCTGLGGAYAGDGTDCSGLQCGAPPNQPRVDGFYDDVLAGVVYGPPIVVQNTNTGFGDSNLGQPDAGNGSELDAAYATIVGDKLYLLLTGNLESNSNQLEIFFDTVSGGQNQLRGDNADIDFDGLNRMGDNLLTPEVEGLMFDEYDNGRAIVPFEADYWVTLSNSRPASNLPVEVYVLYADIPTGGGGTGAYLGEGRCANQTQGGLLNRDPNGNNTIDLLATLDNSNVAGVVGGFGPDFGGAGASVQTGIEVCIPLAALGPPTGDIKICAFINGQQHDFVSNQVLGGILGGPGDNLMDPRFVNFKNPLRAPGQQLFIVPFTPSGCPGARGDANCDGSVDFFDIDPFLVALFNPATYLATFCNGQVCAADTDCTGNIDFFDIDPFLSCLFNDCLPTPPMCP